MADSNFNRGVQTGYETQGNPFSAIMKQVDEAQARKLADQKDLRELQNLFLQLGKKYEYDKALKEQEGEQDIKKEKYKAGLELEKQKQGMDYFSSLMGGKNGESNFPPGSTYSQDVGSGKINMPLNREYTEGETQTLNYADTLKTDIDEMIGLLKSPKSKEAQLTSKIPSIFGLTPEAGGNISGQQFKLLNQRIGQSLLYMKTGKQINEQEYRRFKVFIS